MIISRIFKGNMQTWTETIKLTDRKNQTSENKQKQNVFPYKNFLYLNTTSSMVIY